LPRVAIVILNWNGGRDTLACLESVSAHAGPDDICIVVDNGSSDGSPDLIRQRQPQVEVIENRSNLGFAEGNNVGLRRALEHGAEYAMLLNNDAVLTAGALDDLVAACASEDIGAVSPLILFDHPPDHVWFGGARFDPKRGRSGLMVAYRHPVAEAAIQRGPVDRVAGAAVLIPTAALRAVGMLDERLFFLYEDVDWSLRLRATGRRLMLEPNAVVVHRVSGSQAGEERTPLTLYYGTRNNLVVCRRHAPLGHLGSARRELACVLTHLAGLRRVRANRPRLARAVLRGWSDYRRDRLGPAAGRSARLIGAE
jgi:GT2 family glycosyltransferase